MIQGFDPRICTCPECSKSTLPGHSPRLIHWICCVCGTKRTFIPNGPYSSHQDIDPASGGTRGVCYYTCSDRCRAAFLGDSGHAAPAAGAPELAHLTGGSAV